MSAPPTPSEVQTPAARFAAVFTDLRWLMFYRSSQAPTPPPGRIAAPVSMRLGRWINWIIGRLHKLLEAPPRPLREAAPRKPKAATPEAPASATPEAPAKPTVARVRIPTRRGWIRALAPETRHIPSQFAFLLYDPEIAALVSARPEVARMLRRLFSIVTPQAFPACIAPPPRKPRARKPRPPKPERVKRLRYSKRADLLLMMRGGREHPGGDNPKYGVPHWGIPKRKRGGKG